MNAPDNPFFAPDSPQAVQAFHHAQQVRWDEVRTRLAADRPPDWQGFTFSAVAVHDPVARRFSFECAFQDRRSNRRRGRVPGEVLDLLADLFLTYRNFSVAQEWKKVTIEQIWNPKDKTWGSRTLWDYALGPAR